MPCGFYLWRHRGELVYVCLVGFATAKGRNAAIAPCAIFPRSLPVGSLSGLGMDHAHDVIWISATPTAAPVVDRPTSLSPTQTLCFALASLKTIRTSSVQRPTAHVESCLPRGACFLLSRSLHSNPNASNRSRRSGGSCSFLKRCPATHGPKG